MWVRIDKLHKSTRINEQPLIYRDRKNHTLHMAKTTIYPFLSSPIFYMLEIYLARLWSRRLCNHLPFFVVMLDEQSCCGYDEQWCDELVLMLWFFCKQCVLNFLWFCEIYTCDISILWFVVYLFWILIMNGAKVWILF
jgi:hypothetical protein